MRLLILSILIICKVSFAQAQPDARPLGSISIEFKPESIRLTKAARQSLDSISRHIGNDPEVRLKLVTHYKDLCDKCGSRSWDRVKAIVDYLYHKGIPQEGVSVINYLDGESDRIELILQYSKLSYAAIQDKP